MKPMLLWSASLLMLSACSQAPQAPSPLADQAGFSDGPALVSGIVLAGETNTLLTIQPATNPKPISIIMIPGGGLSSALYTSTPDGRDGWAQQFAKAGYPVYLANPPMPLGAPPPPASTQTGRRGRGGGGWTVERAKTTWGWADKDGTLYDDIRIDFKYADALQAMLSTPRGQTGDLEALTEKLGNVVIIAHSAGGRTGFNIASQSPSALRGLIEIEPVACPVDAARLQSDFVDNLRPLLTIWGDRLDRGNPNMNTRRDACIEAARLINKVGGNAHTDTLPERGIAGNGHLIMVEDNSAAIGADIIAWIEKNVSPQ